MQKLKLYNSPAAVYFHSFMHSFIFIYYYFIIICPKNFENKVYPGDCHFIVARLRLFYETEIYINHHLFEYRLAVYCLPSPFIMTTISSFHVKMGISSMSRISHECMKSPKYTYVYSILWIRNTSYSIHFHDSTWINAHPYHRLVIVVCFLKFKI